MKIKPNITTLHNHIDLIKNQIEDRSNECTLNFLTNEVV